MGSLLIKTACALVCLAALTSCQKQSDNKRQGGLDVEKEKSSAEGRRSFRNMDEYQQYVQDELAKVTEHANKELSKGYQAAHDANPYGKSGARRRHESATSPVTPVKKPPVLKPLAERSQRAIGPQTMVNPYVTSQ